jgi:hypothetical protein
VVAADAVDSEVITLAQKIFHLRIAFIKSPIYSGITENNYCGAWIFLNLFIIILETRKLTVGIANP